MPAWPEWHVSSRDSHMNDPIWAKVSDLCKGYPPEFDAGFVFDIVRNAWQAGLDVVRQPEGANLYQQYVEYVQASYKNADSSQQPANGNQASK